MKMITVQLKTGTYRGNNIKIDGVVIKCKACQFSHMNTILNKFPEDILGSKYRIVINNMKCKLNKNYQNVFEEIMVTNNVIAGNLQTIPIKYLSTDINNLEVGGIANSFPTRTVWVPLRRYFFETFKAVSIENTKNSAESEG